MSKTTQEEGGGLKDDLVKKERRIIQLEAELEESKVSNKRLSTQNSKLKMKGGGTETTQKEDNSGYIPKSSVAEPREHTHEEPAPPKEPAGGLPAAPGVTEKTPEEHVVKSWTPRFCPDKGCGMKNPAFNDEVQCASCKVGLGGKQNAIENISVCPNCGKGKDNGGGWEYVQGAKVV